MDLGIEPNLSVYVPKGISGFYEKQFKRLRTGLQSLKPDSWSSILKCFLNIIAASRAPVPVNILFTCMGLSDEEFEIREAIIRIMSEILPLYEDCLTVYHKSLWDWLVLAGYDEHAFKADVGDGNECLWRVCESIYSDIYSLRSVSDFEMSPGRKYALLDGGNFLLQVGATEDFHWLVNVRVNYLKLKFCNTLNVDLKKILKLYKSESSDPIFGAIVQLCAVLNDINHVKRHRGNLHYLYLEYLANGCFDVLQKTNDYKNKAKNILNESNEVWVEEVRNESNFKIQINSHNVFENYNFSYFCSLFNYCTLTRHAALSPDNKLLACADYGKLEVFNLRSLIKIFQLEVYARSGLRAIKFLIFSPDSSYLLTNSVRTCISITGQKEVTFIRHGPEDIDCCSFSSCGLKLVTMETNLTKVWDVKTQDLLVEVENVIKANYCQFSNCDSHILAVGREQQSSEMAVLFDSKTLAWLKVGDICVDTCLAYQDNYEIISTSFNYRFERNIKIDHVHFPITEKLLVANRYCSKPFAWKNRKCVLFSESSVSASPLVVYDFINKEIIDVFNINWFPRHSRIVYISNLDETHFLICLHYGHIFLLSFETSEESLNASFVNNAVVDCCALSPDNLHIACCYKNNVMTVRSVDKGESLQTVELKQPPKACWWSGVYLWVVCEGVVVKYPYNPTQRKVLGSELEECTVHFDAVLKFEKGVLVIRYKEKITILKFYDKNVCPQQIFDLNCPFNSATISSDGCAVLLCDIETSDYELWEITCENKLELHSVGKFDDSLYLIWLSLTGTTNSRRSLLLYQNINVGGYNKLSSVDFSDNTHRTTHEHIVSVFDAERAIYGDSKYLIIADEIDWIYFVELPNGKITASVYVGSFANRNWNVSSFYIASRSLLVVVGQTGEIHTFEIRNVENY